MMLRTLLVAGSAAVLASPVLAQDLQPFQREALERVLASYPPEQRAMLRPQLEMMFAQMDRATLVMMEEAMMNQEEPVEDEESYPEASDEDLAFNTAQFEPVARGYFEVGEAYDALVDRAVARLGSDTPYAVWGQAWRYELPALNPYRLDYGRDYRAYLQRIEMMAPHDRRYRFDMPTPPRNFDEAAVNAAIEDAFGQYHALGRRFVDEAGALGNAGRHDEALAVEQAAQREAAAIERRLNDRLAVLAPSDKGEIGQALMDGHPVR